MKSRMLLILMLPAMAALTGCSENQPGQERLLGQVPYDRAFEVARDTLVQYSFSVDQESPQTGMIVSKPLPVSLDSAPDAIFRGSTGRQIATLHLYRGKAVTAKLSISLEGLSDVHTERMVLDQKTNYSGVPDESPSQMLGATTPEQNTHWYHVRYERKLETTILDEIYQRLHPAAPTTFLAK